MHPIIKRYSPLGVIIFLSLILAFTRPTPYMHGVMGYTFVFLALFKLLDIQGFAELFQRYDLLAKRLKTYAYFYPFIELSLGLGYLCHIHHPFFYIMTAGLMGFGGLGILWALWNKKATTCACMGSQIALPLGAVSALENGVMTLMALMLLMKL
jgi:hypothetical protein